MIWVSWPATFTGSRDRATGKFLAVVWENLADPIISGRCEIGHPKLYAEIQEPRRWDGTQICAAGWMGFRFLELEVSKVRDAEPVRPAAASDGTLMLKYVPRTGAWGETDLCQVTLTPSDDPDNHIEQRQTGAGTVRFHNAELVGPPDHASCGEALAALPVIEARGGTVTLFAWRKILPRPARAAVAQRHSLALRAAAQGNQIGLGVAGGTLLRGFIGRGAGSNGVAVLQPGPARLVQASPKSGVSLTACSSTGCASFGRLAIRSALP